MMGSDEDAVNTVLPGKVEDGPSFLGGDPLFRERQSVGPAAELNTGASSDANAGIVAGRKTVIALPAKDRGRPTVSSNAKRSVRASAVEREGPSNESASSASANKGQRATAGGDPLDGLLGARGEAVIAAAGEAIEDKYAAADEAARRSIALPPALQEALSHYPAMKELVELARMLYVGSEAVARRHSAGSEATKRTRAPASRVVDPQDLARRILAFPNLLLDMVIRQLGKLVATSESHHADTKRKRLLRRLLRQRKHRIEARLWDAGTAAAEAREQMEHLADEVEELDGFFHHDAAQEKLLADRNSMRQVYRHEMRQVTADNYLKRAGGCLAQKLFGLTYYYSPSRDVKYDVLSPLQKKPGPLYLPEKMGLSESHPAACVRFVRGILSSKRYRMFAMMLHEVQLRFGNPEMTEEELETEFFRYASDWLMPERQGYRAMGLRDAEKEYFAVGRQTEWARTTDLWTKYEVEEEEAEESGTSGSEEEEEEASGDDAEIEVEAPGTGAGGAAAARAQRSRDTIDGVPLEERATVTFAREDGGAGVEKNGVGGKADGDIRFVVPLSDDRVCRVPGYSVTDPTYARAPTTENGDSTAATTAAAGDNKAPRPAAPAPASSASAEDTAPRSSRKTRRTARPTSAVSVSRTTGGTLPSSASSTHRAHTLKARSPSFPVSAMAEGSPPIPGLERGTTSKLSMASLAHSSDRSAAALTSSMVLSNPHLFPPHPVGVNATARLPSDQPDPSRLKLKHGNVNYTGGQVTFSSAPRKEVAPRWRRDLFASAMQKKKVSFDQSGDSGGRSSGRRSQVVGGKSANTTLAPEAAQGAMFYPEARVAVAGSRRPPRTAPTVEKPPQKWADTGVFAPQPRDCGGSSVRSASVQSDAQGFMCEHSAEEGDRWEYNYVDESLTHPASDGADPDVMSLPSPSEVDLDRFEDNSCAVAQGFSGGLLFYDDTDADKDFDSDDLIAVNSDPADADFGDAEVWKAMNLLNWKSGREQDKDKNVQFAAAGRESGLLTGREMLTKSRAKKTFADGSLVDGYPQGDLRFSVEALARLQDRLEKKMGLHTRLAASWQQMWQSRWWTCPGTVLFDSGAKTARSTGGYKAASAAMRAGDWRGFPLVMAGDYAEAEMDLASKSDEEEDTLDDSSTLNTDRKGVKLSGGAPTKYSPEQQKKLNRKPDSTPAASLAPYFAFLEKQTDAVGEHGVTRRVSVALDSLVRLKLRWNPKWDEDSLRQRLRLFLCEDDHHQHHHNAPGQHHRAAQRHGAKDTQQAMFDWVQFARTQRGGIPQKIESVRKEAVASGPTVENTVASVDAVRESAAENAAPRPSQGPVRMARTQELLELEDDAPARADGADNNVVAAVGRKTVAAAVDAAGGKLQRVRSGKKRPGVQTKTSVFAAVKIKATSSMGRETSDSGVFASVKTKATGRETSVTTVNGRKVARDIARAKRQVAEAKPKVKISAADAKKLAHAGKKVQQQTKILAKVRADASLTAALGALQAEQKQGAKSEYEHWGEDEDEDDAADELRLQEEAARAEAALEEALAAMGGEQGSPVLEFQQDDENERQEAAPDADGSVETARGTAWQPEEVVPERRSQVERNEETPDDAERPQPSLSKVLLALKTDEVNAPVKTSIQNRDLADALFQLEKADEEAEDKLRETKIEVSTKKELKKRTSSKKSDEFLTWKSEEAERALNKALNFNSFRARMHAMVDENLGSRDPATSSVSTGNITSEPATERTRKSETLEQNSVAANVKTQAATAKPNSNPKPAPKSGGVEFVARNYLRAAHAHAGVRATLATYKRGEARTGVSQAVVERRAATSVVPNDDRSSDVRGDRNTVIFGARR
eukprot:g6804.t1